MIIISTYVKPKDLAWVKGLLNHHSEIIQYEKLLDSDANYVLIIHKNSWMIVIPSSFTSFSIAVPNFD